MAKTVFFDPRPILKRNQKAAEYTVVSVAQGIQRAVKRSMRSGGKYHRVSKPGEPPRVHRGTLKNLTRWQKMDSFTAIVGPEKVGTASAPVPRVLEQGATVVPSKTVRRLKPNYRRRNFSPEKVRDLNVNKYGEQRSARPFQKKLKNKRRVRYEYFYSYQRWDAAREAPAFQRWATSVTEEVKVKPFKIESRPYMEPALKKVTSEDNLAKIYARAFKKG